MEVGSSVECLVTSWVGAMVVVTSGEWVVSSLVELMESSEDWVTPTWVGVVVNSGECVVSTRVELMETSRE